MSFIDQVFPEKYAYGAIASDDWRNEIIVTNNNREARNLPTKDPRRVWDLATTARTHDERNGIHEWFLAMRGAFHSFAFLDFADNTLTRQQIGAGDGVQTVFQIRKSYTIGSETYQRDITKPIVATVRVWVNNAELVSGWSVSRTTGAITFASPPANGQAIDAACEFHVPVRFAQSRLSWSAINRNNVEGLLFTCDALSLIEVIGE